MCKCWNWEINTLKLQGKKKSLRFSPLLKQLFSDLSRWTVQSCCTNQIIYVEWFFPNHESFAQKISKLGVADWNYQPVRPEFAQPPYQPLRHQVPSLIYWWWVEYATLYTICYDKWCQINFCFWALVLFIRMTTLLCALHPFVQLFYCLVNG